MAIKSNIMLMVWIRIPLKLISLLPSSEFLVVILSNDLFCGIYIGYCLDYLLEMI